MKRTNNNKGNSEVLKRSEGVQKDKAGILVQAETHTHTHTHTHAHTHTKTKVA